MAMSYEQAEAFALTLPGVTLDSSYGQLAPKVRGKPVISRSRELDSFVLRATLEEVEMLKESDPDCFWQTAHYEGWPCVLVRHDTADPDRLQALIERAWWDRASKKQRAERGGERP